ncbi:hypothetical protein AURDEDRAFT_187661 [Auricularia subglabra TFB-10046 SS5]|nr:hypothetical protein AURDEDRAFT_187661 [Auricularia subglabra TFB-10046 SS5]
MSRRLAPISYEVFQQELEAARDAGQITQHDYEIGSVHVRKLLSTRERQGNRAVSKVGGALGAVGSLYYARHYRRQPLSWPVTGMLVTGTAILTSFLPLIPKIYEEASFVQSLDNPNNFQRAVMRALKAASQSAPAADADAEPAVPQGWKEPGAAGPGHSSWDAIRKGQHPPQQQQQSQTPVQDALAARQRQQQEAAASTNDRPQSKDEELEKERREWEEMMAKERELAQGK